MAKAFLSPFSHVSYGRPGAGSAQCFPGQCSQAAVVIAEVPAAIGEAQLQADPRTRFVMVECDVRLRIFAGPPETANKADLAAAVSCPYAFAVEPGDDVHVWLA